MMAETRDIVDLVQQNQSAVTLAVMAGVFVLLFGFACRKIADKRADDPKVILRRCRSELSLVRDELSRYPATHRIQGIVEGLDSAEATIDSVVAKL